MILMRLFDKDLALTQAGGNSDLAKELFEMLIKDLPISNQKILDAHAAKNKQDLWDAVHKIHGGTAYCGVPALKDACKTLEDEIKTEYPSDKIENAITNTTNQIEALLAEANTFLESL